MFTNVSNRDRNSTLNNRKKKTLQKHTRQIIDSKRFVLLYLNHLESSLLECPGKVEQKASEKQGTLL